MFAAEPAVLEMAVEQARQRVLEKARAGKIDVRTEAYLLTLLKHELIDFSKARYGYRRPPMWIKRLGRIWEAVYHLLCVLKRSPEEIGAALVKRRLGRPQTAEDEAAETVSEAIVQEAIREILRQERDCRQPKAPATVSLDAGLDGSGGRANGGPPREIAQSDGAVEQVLDRESIERVLQALRGSLAGNPGTSPPEAGRPSERVLADLDAFAAHLLLTDRERLVLRLVFQEGLSARAAARALNASERGVQRTKRKALEKIAAAFARAGISDPLSTLLSL